MHLRRCVQVKQGNKMKIALNIKHWRPGRETQLLKLAEKDTLKDKMRRNISQMPDSHIANVQQQHETDFKPSRMKEKKKTPWK